MKPVPLTKTRSSPRCHPPSTSSSRRCYGPRHGAQHHAARHLLRRAGWTPLKTVTRSSPSRPSFTSSRWCRRSRRRRARHHTAHLPFVTPRTTTWSSPRCRPPSTSSSQRHGGRRHGGRHHRSRPLHHDGAVENDDPEPAITSSVVFMKPVPQTKTRRTP